MRAPNGACRISCIPPPSSKKRSATIVRSVGTTPSTGLAGAHVGDGLLRAATRSSPQSSTSSACASRVVALVDRRCAIARPRAKVRSCARALRRSKTESSAAIRVRLRRARRRFDAPNPPRIRSEQEDVAGHALDGEIFVERSDDVPVGLGDDVVVAPCPGIAPPHVIAVMRAPRRARRMPLTRS